MNFQKEKKQSWLHYLQYHPAILVLLICVLLLGITYLIRILTPQQQQIRSIPRPNIQSALETDISEATIITPQSIPTLPKTLPVFSSVQRVILLENLLKAFELSPASYPNRYENKEKHRLLTYDPQAKLYEYSDYLIVGDADPAFSFHIDTPKAIQKAYVFVTQTLQFSEFSAVTEKIQYYQKGDDHGETIAAEQANVVEIPFTQKIEGRDVYVGKNARLPLTVFVDSSNKIIGFRLYQDLFSLTNSREVTTINPTEIETLLRTGKADVLRLYGESAEQFDIKKIQKLEITNITVEYRFIPTSNVTFPYLHVEAIVPREKENEQNPLRIIFVVPAVRTSQNER